MDLLAPKFGLLASTLLVVLSLYALYKHKLGANNLAPTVKSDYEKIPKLVWCFFILIGLIIALLCYAVLFADASFWLIDILSKFFDKTQTLF